VIDKAKTLMEAQDIEVMLIHSPENFIYTSGIYNATMRMNMEEGLLSQFVILPRESEPTLLIDSGVLETAEESSWIRDIRTTATGTWLVRERKHENFAESMVEGVKRVLEERSLARGKLGVERKYMTVDTYTRLKDSLPGAQFYDITGILQNLRAVKTEEEISKIRRAIQIAETGYGAAMASISEGVSDFEILNAFKVTVAREGADVAQLICGIGPDGGRLFSHPIGNRARKGDIVRFDLVTIYMGYRSDLSRTAVLGKPPERLAKLHNTLLEAQQKGIRAIKPGIKLSEIHKTIEEVVRSAGYSGYTRSMFGHSVGLECEEEPFISASCDAVFEPNMVFCVEVSWYQPGWVGMNAEDMVLVTEDGCEELSTMPKELHVVK